MASTKATIASLLMVVALMAAGCSGGEQAETPPTSATATSTTGAAVSTSGPVPARPVGLWLGGDPVQSARDECLRLNGGTPNDGPPTADQARAEQACADFPATLTWQQMVSACLAGQGLDEATIAGRRPSDPDRVVVAWAACKSGYSSANPVGPPQVFECMATRGYIVALLTAPADDQAAFSAAMQGCQGDPRQVTAKCLVANGVPADAVPTATVGAPLTRTRRLDPALTEKAWAACRSVYVESTGMPAESAARSLQQPDCMAGRGWLLVVMAGPPEDGAQYAADSAACRPPDPRVAVVACLNQQGIDLSVPGPPTTVPGSPQPAAPQTTKRYDAALAAKAWTACRAEYLKMASSGYGDSNYLGTVDCMVARGWFVFLMSGPPDDRAAYEAASRECQPLSATVPPPTRAGPPAYPSLGDWVACFAAAGVAVHDPSTGPATTDQVFDPAKVDAAFGSCASRYAGILVDAPGGQLACVALLGVVPGLSGPGTWDAISRCELTRTGPFVGVLTSNASDPFLRCLVDNGFPVHPLLRTFEAVESPLARCEGAASGRRVIVAADGSEVDTSVIKYWTCLAGAGLRYPDVRSGSTAGVDLALARRAMSACEASKVTVRSSGSSFGSGYD